MMKKKKSFLQARKFNKKTAAALREESIKKNIN
jgi:hypothetical protein